MKHQSDPRVKIISFLWRRTQKVGEGKLARALTGRFSLKYACSQLYTSFFEQCIMNNFHGNSARILASRKECYVLCPEKSIR